MNAPAEEVYLVYITAANAEEASTLGRALVEKRLAACVNVIPALRSFYWWEGKLVEDEEALLLAKTFSSRLPQLMEAVRSLHSYSVPAISALPVAHLNPAYRQWMEEVLG
ncbi:MAG: divalent-cation tolerance protein CutA [Bacillota bacterium]|nr:divalent-cation tolerance protein CutA [Bacillota bacterium]